MPQVPSNPAPPQRRRGRRNVRQAEIYDALVALRRGVGRLVEGEHGERWLCVALDREKVPGLSSATAALYNLRHRLNPKRATGNPEEFNRLFGHGRGTIKIEEQGDYLLIFVPASYAEEAEVVSAKPKKKKAAEAMTAEVVAV